MVVDNFEIYGIIGGKYVFIMKIKTERKI